MDLLSTLSLPESRIDHIIEAHARANPKAVAILAPGRTPLTYDRLSAHILDVGATLRGMRLGSNDRVALVLPNGPEMATAFLAVSSCATSAPLNPAHRFNDFDFFLRDLDIKALMILPGLDSPAANVARKHGIPVIDLTPLQDEPAGLFALRTDSTCHKTPSARRADDVALVLYTSGSTSRPKIVARTHTNVCAASRNMIIAHGLVATDRCLNVMPLYHSHGLTVVGSSILAGASVVCTPGIDADQFFSWLEEFRPTWYSATPAMHQAILAQAARNKEIIRRYPLRFVRSSSSHLTTPLMTELERVFNAPVLDNYGVTESGTVVCTPLPPRARKPGSIGVPVGTEVAVMDEAGALLQPGQTGEIVFRGPNISTDPETDAQVSQNSWFHSGDQGFSDEAGYFYLTGRLKEIINRGGQKISPYEVEETLMQHPAVRQAAAFAVPHKTLGEDVAAAVVLDKGKSSTSVEIRKFVASRLSDCKVPRRVMIVDEIPKSSTGKLQRIGLAEKLGLTFSGNGEVSTTLFESASDHPQTALQGTLVKIWENVLGVDHVGIYDDFFLLGGNSMHAAQIITRIYQATRMQLTFSQFFDSLTVSDLSRELEEWSKESA